MELTGEQQAVLDGSRGDYLAKCMRWLVDWGEVMGAKRLIKVDNTHALLPVPNLMAQGASKETMDRYMADLVEACSHGTHPGCTCTVHAAFVTLDDVDVPENDPEQVQMQKDLAVLAADADLFPLLPVLRTWWAMCRSRTRFWRGRSRLRWFMPILFWARELRGTARRARLPPRFWVWFRSLGCCWMRIARVRFG